VIEDFGYILSFSLNHDQSKLLAVDRGMFGEVLTVYELDALANPE
jgi:hypothetical protein